MPERNGDGAGTGRGGWLKTLRDLPNDSPLKTVLITFAVCIVASVLVATSAVLLKPVQEANKERERRARLAEIIARVPDAGVGLGLGKAGQLEARVVELATGRYVTSIDPARFDQRRAAQDLAQSVTIPPKRDLAQIKRRSRYSVVYLLRRDGRLGLVILPVHGRGFGSVLRGYLGLTADTRRVVGLVFYEHAETPGLGALIDDRKWLDKWAGKKVWDDALRPALGVADGEVAPGSAAAPYTVDGLTGATWTSRGVTNLLRFWLGDDGFGPYLDKLRTKGG